MKAIIVCSSVSHGNTKRIADVMGQILEARVVEPGQINAAELATYDLVGFGSGIFNMAFHPELRDFGLLGRRRLHLPRFRHLAAAQDRRRDPQGAPRRRRSGRGAHLRRRPALPDRRPVLTFSGHAHETPGNPGGFSCSGSVPAAGCDRSGTHNLRNFADPVPQK